MKIGHVDWLLNRIEGLEMQLSINTNNMKQLQKENECYKQRVEELEEREKIYKEIIQSYGKIADGFVDDIERLVKRNERYKQALEFYADEENHIAPYLYTQKDNVPVHDESKVDRDGGKKARQALKGE